MDDRRFDNWTRSLAGQRTRRNLMRGLAGGGALLALAGLRLPGASARHGTSGPGEPCRHDGQCVAADTALVCAWNGFGGDGDYNCCAYDGSRCGDDSGCCGLSVCVNGFCSAGDQFVRALLQHRVAGSFSGEILLENETLTSAGAEDIFLFKLEP